MTQAKNKNRVLKRGLGILGILGFAIICFAIFQSFKTEASANSDDLTEFVQTSNGNYEVQKVFPPSFPENPSFCGEEVDLTDPEIAERLDRELVVNSFLHSSTILILKKVNRYFPMIEKILKEEGVPDDMKYLCVAESGLAQVVSPAGASGFWQFMKKTGQEYGLYSDNDIDERYNIEKSTYAACKYLKDSKNKFGSWALATAAYNAGNNGVMGQINLQGQDSYFDLYLNNETSRYVFRIIALKYIIENPASFGFNLNESQLYKPLKAKSIKVSDSYVDWVNFANANGVSYKTLRYYNPQIRRHEWNNKANKEIEVYLPFEAN